jgi:hypothetical protein
VRVGFGITGASKAESDLDRLKNKLTGIQKAGAGGVLKGVGLGIGIGLVNQTSSAIYGLAGAIGDATQAAIADEASQQKLRSSLEANVTGWDGNTKAIEKTLAARMKLGFSDDEQRDSLAKIVAATGDVNKALEVQRTAMDLARLKGISLADAGDALIKVEAGQFRALKGLGIVLKEGATAQDALNAVQKIATGQAEDYAKTTGGKVLAAQTKMNEAMENLGYKLLPVVATAADAASVAIDGLAIAFGNVDEETGKATPGIIDFIPGIAQIKNISEDLPKVLDDFSGSARGLATHLKEDAKPAIEDVTEKTSDFQRASEKASKSVLKSWDDIVDGLKEDTQTLIDEVFDPIETRTDILDAHRQLSADIAALAAAKTSTATHDAANAIIQDLDDQGQGLIELSDQHALTQKDVDKYKADVTAAYKAMGRAIPPQIQKILDKLAVLAAVTAKPFTVKVIGGKVQDFSTQFGGPRASGGPVRPDRSYYVGEEGPEKFTPDVPGTITPTGSGGDTYNLTFTGAIGQDQNNIIAQVNRMRYYSRSKKAA